MTPRDTCIHVLWVRNSLSANDPCKAYLDDPRLSLHALWSGGNQPPQGPLLEYPALPNSRQWTSSSLGSRNSLDNMQTFPQKGLFTGGKEWKVIRTLWQKVHVVDWFMGGFKDTVKLSSQKSIIVFRVCTGVAFYEIIKQSYGQRRGSNRDI